MAHWPFWISGLALAGIALLNWFVVHRMLAVSGRFSGLVDHFREGRAETEAMSSDELVAAARAATLEAFGGVAVDEPAHAGADLRVTAPRSITSHLLFFASLAVGGALSMFLASGFEPTAGLRGSLFSRLTDGSGVLGPLVLLLGGVLVGFGTRMASGCTSGHGLCGVSRFQLGSLVATAAFFGVGIVVSFILGGFL